MVWGRGLPGRAGFGERGKTPKEVRCSGRGRGSPRKGVLVGGVRPRELMSWWGAEGPQEPRP